MSRTAMSLAQRSLALTMEFTNFLLEHDEVEIPTHATLIVLPNDDPELFQYEFEMASQAIVHGKNVYLYHWDRSSHTHQPPSPGENGGWTAHSGITNNLSTLT